MTSADRDTIAGTSCAAILQTTLDGAPWDRPHTARLPGIEPLNPADWLVVDDAYAAQLAVRDALIDTRRAAVIGMLPGAAAAVAELHATVLEALKGRSEFDVGPHAVRRPDGRAVALVPADPLGTLGRLVAEDLCVLERPEGHSEHVLTAAVLCFPSHWTLAEKLGRAMMRIHGPVPRYDTDVGRRVQRMFDGLRPGRMLTRMNALPTDDPALFAPMLEADSRKRAPAPTVEGVYLRSERQCLLKLPHTGAVIFSIQTRMVARAALSAVQAAGLAGYLASGGQG